MEKISIAIAHRGAGLAPVFAAVEGGYFREQELEPRLDYVPGHPRALEMLITGQTDFINTVGPELILANDRHCGDAVIIASAISRSAQQVSARPGLTTREQLRGRRWGVTARSDADECSIVMAFERWNWDIARDAEIVVVGSNGPRLDLLLDERKVDVAIMHAPEPFQAIKRGWEIVEDLGRLDVAFQNSCAATTSRLISERPDTAVRYVRAYCRGVYRFRTDAEFGIGVLRKYTGETGRDRARADLGTVRAAHGRHDVPQRRRRARRGPSIVPARCRFSRGRSGAASRSGAGGGARAGRLLRDLRGEIRRSRNEPVIQSIIDAHHHIWRLSETPWLQGPPVPISAPTKAFAATTPLRNTWPMPRRAASSSRCSSKSTWLPAERCKRSSGCSPSPISMVSRMR